MTKKFLSYALPSALAMCISSFNTVLDGVFLGQGVGDAALAAVNIVMPLTILFFGLATMVAVGGGSLVSKNFGAGDKERANQVFRQVMKALLIGALVLSLICVLFAEAIVGMMGATNHLVPLSAEYLRYYALFCIPNLMGIALGSFLRNDQKPQQAMIATVCGTICNITLNYIFIFRLGLGIKSAAIATGIGQMVTVLMMLPHFLLKKGELSFGKSKMEFKLLKEVFRIGMPSFIAEAAFSVIILIHNMVITVKLGETGLSTYAIVNYVTTNIYMILLGVTFGAQPLISFNFGCKKKKEMYEVYKLSIKTSLIITFCYCVICLIYGKYIIGFFTSNEAIGQMSYRALNINNLAYFMIGMNLTQTVYYQAIERPKYSNIIGALRSIVILPVVLISFTYLWGEVGIWLSMFASEVVTFIIIHRLVNLKECTEQMLCIESSKSHN